MDRASVKRQLAALFLSLLALVAFSGSVLADCMAAFADVPEMAESDCHEAMNADCAHHMADSACMEAVDCGNAEPVLLSGERKKAQDQEPDLLLLAETTGPPDPRIPAPETALSSSRTPDSRQLYLSFCRFLE